MTLLRAGRRSVLPLAALALVALLATATLVGCDSDGSDPEAEAEITVMTYNLYLGADIFELTTAEPTQVPFVAAALFAQAQENDFTARAAAIAEIIAEEDPDLIGLQEVSLYRTQTPSDFAEGPNATEVAIDYLDILLDALEAQGLDYTAVATTENADVELPASDDGVSFFDVRLTDRDVILARSGIAVGNVVEETFADSLIAPVPVGGEVIPFLRGYNAVDATVSGVTFTFANAHLEVDDGDPEGAALAQFGQAFSLVTTELADAELPVVLVGDFNSSAEGGATVNPATGLSTYGLLTATYTDAAAEAGATGDTCCFDADLSADADLDSRIDLVLYRGDVETLSAEVVGDEEADQTPGGLWPSDHAGVVATLRLRD